MKLMNLTIREMSREVFEMYDVNGVWLAGDYANCSATETSTVDFVIDGDIALFSKIKDRLSKIFNRKVTVKSVDEVTSDDIIMQIYSKEKVSWVGGKVKAEGGDRE